MDGTRPLAIDLQDLPYQAYRAFQAYFFTYRFTAFGPTSAP